MRVAIATVQVPFIWGGAEIHAEGLVRAMREAGHDVELISMPFRFSPIAEVIRSMEIWSTENFETINGYHPDVVICLKFPTFYLNHSNKVAWILHQHRDVYDLWETSFIDGFSQTDEAKHLKREITQRDTQALRAFHNVFTNAKTVSDRLYHFNRVASTPLYHPPKFSDCFYTAPSQPYIFFPSRLESLKRQDLLIKAMKLVHSPVIALIAGEGGQFTNLQRMTEQFDLSTKVRLLGKITEAEKLSFYANCLGVFFGPFNEDYGYVTLEAMLASKPVITCNDSGGPTEFVIHGETGLIVEPTPDAIARAIDRLYANSTLAKEMGAAGKERYNALDISWENVVQKLLA